MSIVPLIGKFAREVANAVRRFQYERTSYGLYLPRQKLHLGGVFRTARVAPDGTLFDFQVDPNRVVDEGINYILGAALRTVTPAGAFYLAPFSGNVTPAASWTASNFASTATEFTAYTAANRLPWTTAAASGKQIGNTGALSDATATFSAGGPYTLYGVALLSAQAKGATTGVLVSATRFSTTRSNLAAGDKLAFEYIVGASDEADAT